MDLGNMQWKGGGSFKQLNSIKSTYDSRAYAMAHEEEERRKAQQMMMQEMQSKIDAGELNPDGTEKKNSIFKPVGDFFEGLS